MAEYLTEERDQTMILCISGTLTIQDAQGLKSELVNAFDKAQAIEIDVSSVTEADVSCLQLLCSAHRTSKQANKVFGLADDASDSFKKSVRQAGYARPNGCANDTASHCLWNEEKFHG
jgi:ABC-type transporter Mla MlaB component